MSGPNPSFELTFQDLRDQPTILLSASYINDSEGRRFRPHVFIYGCDLNWQSEEFASLRAFGQECRNHMGVDLAKFALNLSREPAQDEIDQYIEAAAGRARVTSETHGRQCSYPALVMTPKVYDEWSSVHQPMKQDQENSRKIDGYYVPIQINVPVIDSSKQSKGGWSFWSRGSQESKSTCTKPIYIGSAICPNIFEPRSTYNPPRLKEFHKKYLETFGNSTVCPNEKEISELAEEHDFRIGVFTLSPETADKLCFLDDPNDPEVSTDSQAATHAGSVEQP